MKVKEMQESISPVCQASFSRLKTVFGLLGFQAARFKGSMDDRDLTLRIYRLRDLFGLSFLCEPEVFLAASGVRLRAFSSLMSFWWWMHTTFQVFFVIEVAESNHGHRMIGFLGIYKIKLGESLWMSLAPFDPKDRKRGYGQRMLRLFLSCLQEDCIVESVCGEILTCNTGSLRLLKRLGFEIFSQEHDRLLLRKPLGG